MSTATIKPDRLPTSSANEDEWGKEEPPHEDKGLPLAAVTPSTASDDDGTVAFESRLKRCLQMQKGHPLGYPLSGVLGCGSYFGDAVPRLRSDTSCLHAAPTLSLNPVRRTGFAVVM